MEADPPCGQECFTLPGVINGISLVGAGQCMPGTPGNSAKLALWHKSEGGAEWLIYVVPATRKTQKLWVIGTLFLECEILRNYHDFHMYNTWGGREAQPQSASSYQQWFMREFLLHQSCDNHRGRKETAKTKWFLVAANCSKSAQLSAFWKTLTREQRVENQHENHQVFFGTGNRQRHFSGNPPRHSRAIQDFPEVIPVKMNTLHPSLVRH